MKKILLILITSILSTFNAVSQENEIQDGWYKATVKCSNFMTSTFETHILNVKVKSEQVIEIKLLEGGSIYSGYNNEGYTYSGGILYSEKDYKGKIISYEASVNIYESNGTVKNFKIKIK